MASSSSDGASRWIETSSRLSSSRSSLGSARQAPQLTFFAVGRFLKLLSVYALFRALAGGESVVVFMFVCLLVSGALFLIFQRPWRGRPLSSSQTYLTVMNGGILALAFVLWGKGLQACGPVRAVLAEYTGAILGAASTLALGRGGHKWKKGGGLAAMLVAFVFVYRGWSVASLAPFSSGSGDEQEHVAGLGSVIMLIAAGTLFALRRVVARRVSLKATIKKRLHAVTVAAAACFLFPFTVLQLSLGESSTNTGKEAQGSLAWAYISTITFGMMAGFYVDTYAEERLHILATSSEHLLVTSILLIFLEVVIYPMDFSLVGFLICSALLGLGIYESTSTSERSEPEIVSSTASPDR